jgi:hypothetical protein
MGSEDSVNYVLSIFVKVVIDYTHIYINFGIQHTKIDGNSYRNLLFMDINASENYFTDIIIQEIFFTVRSDIRYYAKCLRQHEHGPRIYFSSSVLAVINRFGFCKLEKFDEIR